MYLGFGRKNGDGFVKLGRKLGKMLLAKFSVFGARDGSDRLGEGGEAEFFALAKFVL